MKKFYLILASLAALISVPAGAQFNSMGGEKASTRWQDIKTPNYTVIFPEGLDSLGTRYATLLERYRPLVGASAGFYPNEMYRKPMPIVLHPFAGISNGAVAWAPRRMEIYTFADPYGFLPPVPWEKILSIHENRHVAQMQFSRSGFWRWLHYPFGQLPAMYIDGMVSNSAIIEGDAVATETALTSSGRGRDASFLAYFRMSFDNGDTRDWYRWRYGSQKFYTPDYYRIGYMTVAGARTFYDAPMFMSSYLHRLSKPLPINALSSTLKEYSGKRLEKSWEEIASGFTSMWAEEDAQRGTFQTVEPIAFGSRFFTGFVGAVETSDGRLLSLRSGLDRNLEIVEILDGGKVRPIRAFASDSKLAYSPVTDCVYWSEAIRSPRWELLHDSKIRKMKVGTKNIQDVTLKGRYANPAVSADGKYLAASEYPVKGGSRLVLISLDDEREIKSIIMPDGLNVTEMAFVGDGVIFTGVSDNGMGLYRTDFSQVETLEAAMPFTVKDLVAHEGKLYFSSDKSGVSEIYSYDNGDLRRLTNTKYGVTRPFFWKGKLHFTALQPSGRLLATTGSSFNEKVNFAGRAEWKIADKLAAQEAAITPTVSSGQVSAPERYSKARNFLHVHSWIPAYYNYDSFSATETEYQYQTLAFGATGFFQNMTGTVAGILGVSLHENPFDVEAPGTGLHGRLTYAGLLPVFDLAFDIGDRSPADIFRVYDIAKDSLYVDAIQREGASGTYLGGKATVYVPLEFTSGGWERSIVPMVSVSASNDRLAADYKTVFSDESSLLDNVNFQAGLTASAALPGTNSGIFPRLGIGASAKYTTNSFSNSLYFSGHTYLPGLMSVHGLKLSAAYQDKRVTNGSDVWNYGMENMAPRGFEESSAGSWMNLGEKKTVKLSADYAMPVLPLDIAIGPYFYFRNMELNPFADLSFVNKSSDYIYSAGADIVFRFEKALIFASTMKLGFRVAYNNGSIFDKFGLDDHFYIGTVFNGDLF